MTSKTRAALSTEQTTNFADNTTGAITPAVLRGVVQDLIDSMATQLDGSSFTGSVYSFPSITVNGSTSGSATIIATGAAGSTSLTLPNAGIDTFATLGAPQTLFNKTVSGGLIFAGSTSGASTLIATGVAGSTTLTLPAATDTLVGAGAIQTLANKTIDTGTPNTIKISSVQLFPGQYPGTSTNDNATAGNFGEEIESNILVGSAVSLATGSAKNITSIAVTAGDWDISGNIGYQTASGTSVTALFASISSTSATLDVTTGGRTSGISQAAVIPGASNVAFFVPSQPTRFSFASTTTIFLVTQATFSGGALNGYGLIRARRMR